MTQGNLYLHICLRINFLDYFVIEIWIRRLQIILSGLVYQLDNLLVLKHIFEVVCLLINILLFLTINLIYINGVYFNRKQI